MSLYFCETYSTLPSPLWHIFEPSPVYPQSRKTVPKTKISTIAERVWYNEIDGGSQPQEGAMYL